MNTDKIPTAEQFWNSGIAKQVKEDIIKDVNWLLNMEKDKIPTAEEFMGDMTEMYLTVDVNAKIEKVKEFAKLHVKAALEAAANNACINSINMGAAEFQDVVDRDSILNAYPEENIK